MGLKLDISFLVFFIILILFTYGVYVVVQYAHMSTPEKYNPANPLGLKITNFIVTREGFSFVLENPNDFDVEFVITYGALTTSLGQRCSIHSDILTGRRFVMNKKSKMPFSISYYSIDCPDFGAYTKIPNIVFTLTLYYTFEEEDIEKGGVIRASTSPTS